MPFPSLQFSRSEGAWLGGAIGAAALAGVLTAVEASPIVRFVAAAVALALLARSVGTATEQLGERLSAGATGIVQGAFGNLPELFVALFSLRAGLRDVVRAALVGSILANLVLVLGVAILVGGIRNGTQRFDSQAPRTAATLLLLAVTALAVPTLADTLHTPAQPHEAALSATCALVLLVVFGASLRFTLAGDPAVAPPAAVAPAAVAAGEPGAGHAHHGWPLAQSVAVLGVSGLGAALVSDWFVDALLPATRSLGLSQTFTGLVVVAIAGNAVENAVAVSLAAKNKPDYAISVVLNSALQIALALTPVLVLASFFIGPAPMTLVLPPILLAALTLAALVSAFVVYDGESIWLEGVALIGLYVMFGAAVWWG